jgi:hypothetical protein
MAGQKRNWADAQLHVGAGNLGIPPGVPIEFTPDHLARLRSLVHKREVLERNAFYLRDLSKEELEWKKKCVNCGKGGKRELPAPNCSPHASILKIVRSLTVD